MDFNVLAAGIFGIAGALMGAIVGAWLNPLMQEWQEKRKLKLFMKKCSDIEKFIIFNAYDHLTFLPIDIKIPIDIMREFNESKNKLHSFIQFFIHLETQIQKLKEERIIFAIRENDEQYYKGYTISLYSNVNHFISKNPKIKNELMQETKRIIKIALYPYYKCMLEKTNFDKIGIDTLNQYVRFLGNIGVFNLTGHKITHLDFTNPKTYLELPKGELHPEFSKN